MFFGNITDELDFLEIPVKSFSIDKNSIELRLPEKLKVISQSGDNSILIKGSREFIEKMAEDNE